MTKLSRSRLVSRSAQTFGNSFVSLHEGEDASQASSILYTGMTSQEFRTRMKQHASLPVGGSAVRDIMAHLGGTTFEGPVAQLPPHILEAGEALLATLMVEFSNRTRAASLGKALINGMVSTGSAANVVQCGEYAPDYDMSNNRMTWLNQHCQGETGRRSILSAGVPDHVILYAMHFAKELLELNGKTDLRKITIAMVQRLQSIHGGAVIKKAWELYNAGLLHLMTKQQLKIVQISEANDKYKALVDNGKSPDDALAIIKASGKFSAGTISHLKSSVVERSETRDEYNRLLADDMKPDDALAKLKASDKFSAGSISHLESSNKKSLASVELNKLKKSGMSSKDGIAKLKKSGKLSADDKWLECNDKKGQAWAIHRKLKKQKSLEEIRDEIRDNRDLGAKYANLVYNLMTSAENKISRETAGMRRHVNEVETALENGKTILVAIHNPVGCKGECLFIWDDKSRHKQKNATYNTKVGDIKFEKINCGSCNTRDRDFTSKSAVTNSYETIFFDKESNSNIVKLTSVADLTSWSKEKERTIRERHESEASATDEDATNDSTASAAAAKQPPAKKEKATKSKSASSKKTQSKSKRKPSEEKEEKKKKKKKKLKKLDSSKDSKMAAPAKKKDISKKAVPKKKSTKSKSSVGTSSNSASMPSKSSKSKGKRRSSKADNGSKSKNASQNFINFDVTKDRQFKRVRKLHKDDLSELQIVLDRLMAELIPPFSYNEIVLSFVEVYENGAGSYETIKKFLYENYHE